MGKEYKGSIDVKHFVHVLVEEVGLDKIRLHAPPRLLELKWRATLDVTIAPEYINHDDPWEPKYLHQLVELRGYCGGVRR